MGRIHFESSGYDIEESADGTILVQDPQGDTVGEYRDDEASLPALATETVVQGTNPAETISETSSPTSFNFDGTTERDIHDATDVTASNGTTADVTEDITVDLYDGADSTGTLIASNTVSVTVAAGGSATTTILSGDDQLDTGTYYVEVTTSGTDLSVDQTDVHTLGATYTVDQTVTGSLTVTDQQGRDVLTADPITNGVAIPSGALSVGDSQSINFSNTGVSIKGYPATNYAALRDPKGVGDVLTWSNGSGTVRIPNGEVTISGNKALRETGTTTDPALGFATWRTADANRPVTVLLEVYVETDGTSDGTIEVDVDESGGTTADYTYTMKQAASLGSSNDEDYRAIYLPPGAAYQIRNVSDPNAVNAVTVHREVVE